MRDRWYRISSLIRTRHPDATFSLPVVKRNEKNEWNPTGRKVNMPVSTNPLFYYLGTIEGGLFLCLLGEDTVLVAEGNTEPVNLSDLE
jgi:hypothetical protein